MEKKKVLVTGVTGQDGSFMVDYLLENTDHDVYGLVRRASIKRYDNIKHILDNPRFKIVEGDLSDAHSLNIIVSKIVPDYFINLAAQSFVGVSWKIPAETFRVDAIGVINCLEAIRTYAPKCRFYNAGSSEEFGDVVYSPQDEKHPMRPRSPYGAAKVSARFITKVYRESYGLYAIQGLLFNHESERRGEEFVTRKITKAVARISESIKNGEDFTPLELGNLDSKRDWSHASDFVDGIWKMLNQDEYRVDYIKELDEAQYMGDTDLVTLKFPKDIKEYILSSNETHTVREFVELAFKAVGISGQWHFNKQNNPISEQFILTGEGFEKPIVLLKINPEFFRPAEVDLLWGDSTQARTDLNWRPKISFQELVDVMVKKDVYDQQYERKL